MVCEKFHAEFVLQSVSDRQTKADETLCQQFHDDKPTK